MILIKQYVAVLCTSQPAEETLVTDVDRVDVIKGTQPFAASFSRVYAYYNVVDDDAVPVAEGEVPRVGSAKCSVFFFSDFTPRSSDLTSVHSVEFFAYFRSFLGVGTKKQNRPLPPTSTFYHCRSFLSTYRSILVLLSSTLSILGIDLRVILNRNVSFRRRNIIRPLSRLVVNRSLVVRLFRLNGLYNIDAFTDRSRTTITRMKMTLKTGTLGTYRKTIFSDLIVRYTGRVGTTLLMNLGGLELIESHRIHFALDCDLYDLHDKLMQDRFRLITNARETRRDHYRRDLKTNDTIGNRKCKITYLSVNLRVIRVLRIR